MSDPRPSTAIVTDSTSDLPQADALELGIEVVPALITVGDQTLVDGIGISREELYRRMPDLTKPVTTAAPSPAAFAEAYERLLAKGAKQIISIHVSSKLSGILNAANQAAADFKERVRLVDSAQVSLGIAFQAKEAALQALGGAPLEAVLGAVKRAREKMKLIAFIDTLEYLRRGGRVSWLRAGLGTILQVKLLLEVADGLAEQLDRVRTRSKALQSLVSHARSWGPLKRLGVPHAAALETAHAIAEELRPLSELPPEIVDVTPVIGAHVGPGAVGIVGMQA